MNKWMIWGFYTPIFGNTHIDTYQIYKLNLYEFSIHKEEEEEKKKNITFFAPRSCPFAGFYP